MRRQLSGIHHVTAIAGDPQQNIDFYTHVLGLRLVKLTVNFDDPSTYHLYYGDYSGNPGTIVTFFPWRGATPGRVGAGEVTVISFSVPAGSLAYWKDRLNSLSISTSSPEHRFNEEVLSLKDPDGMQLELVASERTDIRTGWVGGPVPSHAAIRGLYQATLSAARFDATKQLLTGLMGFRGTGTSGDRIRFETGAGGPHAIVDLVAAPKAARGLLGTGSVHHIAWRTASDSEQAEWLRDIQNIGLGVSPVMDRKYFHSIYYREPGGVLFEIATDPPGFSVDEPLERLGETLVLPPWLERQRDELTQILPKLEREKVQQHA